MNHLSDALYVELETAIGAIESYGTDKAWHYLENWKLFEVWEALFQAADQAGWEDFIRDDGKTVSIRHPHSGLSTTFVRNLLSYDKDEMSANRFKSILKASLEYRKSQFDSIKSISAVPNPKAGGRPKITSESKYLDRLTHDEQQVVKAWKKFVRNTTPDEQGRRGWKAQTYRAIAEQYNLQQGQVKDIVDKWRKWQASHESEK